MSIKHAPMATTREQRLAAEHRRALRQVPGLLYLGVLFALVTVWQLWQLGALGLALLCQAWWWHRILRGPQLPEGSGIAFGAVTVAVWAGVLVSGVMVAQWLLAR